MYYKYDLESVDLEDCDRLLLLPINADAVPAIMGTLEALAWRARHVSDASFDVGTAMYHELQEVFNVNNCLMDSLGEIRDAITSLLCICTGAADARAQTATMITETIYKTLEDNTDVSYSPYTGGDVTMGEPPIIPSGERCQRSQAVWYNINSVMGDVVNLQLGVAGVSAGALAGLIAFFLAVPIPVTIVIGLIVGIAFVFVEQDVKDALDVWLTLAQEGVCTIYNSVDMLSASQAIAAMVDANISNVAARTYIKTFFGNNLMCEFWENSTNFNSFPAAFCVDCAPLPENCESYSPCVLEDWLIPDPLWMVCNGGYPQIRAGYARYQEETLAVPAYDSWVKIHWIPRSDDDSPAIADFDLYLQPGDIHIPLYPTAAKAANIPTYDVYHFNGTVGKTIQLQPVKASWYFDILQMCVYDYDPEA